MTIQTSRKASVLSEKYRDILPANFLWGAASAAYQVEGAHLTDGKSLSVWDTTLPAHEDACKSYELFEKDIDLLKKLGCGVYRFSIAWTRILPGGEQPLLGRPIDSQESQALLRMKKASSTTTSSLTG